MHFTIHEKFGDKSVSDWIETRLKAEVLQTYGVAIQVSVHLANATIGPDGGTAYASPSRHSD